MLSSKWLIPHEFAQGRKALTNEWRGKIAKFFKND